MMIPAIFVVIISVNSVITIASYLSYSSYSSNSLNSKSKMINHDIFLRYDYSMASTVNNSVINNLFIINGYIHDNIADIIEKYKYNIDNLVFDSCYLNITSFTKILSLIFHPSQSDMNIKYLSINHCLYDDNILNLMNINEYSHQYCNPLEVLDISSNNCNSKTMNRISSLLSSCQSLKSIIFDNNHINSDDLRHVVHILRKHSSCCYISLSNCDLDDVSIEYLNYLIKSNQNITFIDISNNQDVTVDGMMSLLDSLKIHGSIECLDVSYCHVGNEGINKLCDLIEQGYLCSLKYLILKEVNCDYNSLQRLLTVLSKTSLPHVITTSNTTSSSTSSTLSISTSTSSTSPVNKQIPLKLLDISGNKLFHSEKKNKKKSKSSMISNAAINLVSNHFNKIGNVHSSITKTLSSIHNNIVNHKLLKKNPLTNRNERRYKVKNTKKTIDMNVKTSKRVKTSSDTLMFNNDNPKKYSHLSKISKQIKIRQINKKSLTCVLKFVDQHKETMDSIGLRNIGLTNEIVNDHISSIRKLKSKIGRGIEHPYDNDKDVISFDINDVNAELKHELIDTLML